MSNPTELPDLDRIANDLESEAIPYEGDFADAVRAAIEDIREVAAARRAQPERLSIALREVTDKLSATAAENLSLNMANIDLRDQLARLTGIRPEGEAPQADLTRRQKENAEFSEWWASSGQQATHDLTTENAAHATWQERARRAATLSPLCGAQHEESGKDEFAEVSERTADLQVENDRLREQLADARMHWDDAHEAAEEAEQALAAQQAAAPAPRLSETKVWEAVKRHAQSWTIFNYAEFDREGLDAFAIELMDSQRAASSAPGTPEAPKPPFPISDDEMAALRRFWECATDGEGYDVEKPMMQRLAEMGLVQRKSGSYYMSTDFGLYVLGEYTIQRAAQLDGGQEGSESNG